MTKIDPPLVASAQRITRARINPSTQVGRGRTASPSGDTQWQEDAWDMYGLIGELSFLVNTLANRTGQARFYVGRITEDSTEDPEHVIDQKINDVLTALADSPKQLRQHVSRLAACLAVVGEGWLVGVPATMMPASLLTSMSLDPAQLDMPRQGSSRIGGETNLGDIEWRALSTTELDFPEEGKVTVTLGSGPDETPTFDVDSVLLIRVWRPHPKNASESDCSVRSLLPVLRTLVGMDMRNAAQIDSRLAGAGMLIVPATAQRALQNAAAALVDPDSTVAPPVAADGDQFTDALMTAMVTAIKDRASASSFVPIVATVPDDVTDKFNYLDFARPLDQYGPDLIDQALRRVALGMDCPPELLLGQGSMNHWGAWLSSIETVRQHITPTVELICDALTTQYLWPVLVSAFGMSQEEARSHVIWYEVEHLIVRPNRAAEAMDLFDRGIISAEAVRREAGYEEGDAPEEPPASEPAPAVVVGQNGTPGDGQAPATDDNAPPSQPGTAAPQNNQGGPSA